MQCTVANVQHKIDKMNKLCQENEVKQRTLAHSLYGMENKQIYYGECT